MEPLFLPLRKPIPITSLHDDLLLSTSIQNKIDNVQSISETKGLHKNSPDIPIPNPMKMQYLNKSFYDLLNVELTLSDFCFEYYQDRLLSSIEEDFPSDDYFLGEVINSPNDFDIQEVVEEENSFDQDDNTETIFVLE